MLFPLSVEKRPLSAIPFSRGVEKLLKERLPRFLGVEQRAFRAAAFSRDVETTGLCQGKIPRASGQTLCLKILEILPSSPMLTQRGNIGRPAAGGRSRARLHCVCSPKRHSQASRLRRYPSALPAFFEDRPRCPHDTRRAAKPQGETGGRGGNYFPRIALTCSDSGATQPPVGSGHAVLAAGLARRPLRLRRK